MYWYCPKYSQTNGVLECSYTHTHTHTHVYSSLTHSLTSYVTFTDSSITDRWPTRGNT